MDIYGITGSKKPSSNGLQKGFPEKSLKTTINSGHLIAWVTNLNQVANLLGIYTDYWRVLRNQPDQANIIKLLKENRENLPNSKKSFRNPKESFGSS